MGGRWDKGERMRYVKEEREAGHDPGLEVPAADAKPPKVEKGDDNRKERFVLAAAVVGFVLFALIIVDHFYW